MSVNKTFHVLLKLKTPKLSRSSLTFQFGLHLFPWMHSITPVVKILVRSLVLLNHLTLIHTGDKPHILTPLENDLLCNRT